MVNYGLTEVYKTTPYDPQFGVDIVFVHGLNGDALATWTSDVNGVFWPRDLLPEELHGLSCRILTYGYNSTVATFTDSVSRAQIHHHAEDLTARLAADRSTEGIERPIVFVCHSLGGLVTKQCLIYSRSISDPRLEHLRSIYVSTYGIVFMGTPHNGSDLAKWGSLLQSIAATALPRKLFDSSSSLVNALKTNNETLQNINMQFVTIIPRFHIFLFYEGKPTDMKGTRAFVVDIDSAAPLFQGAERMAIEKDHSHMCKFETADSAFRSVADALRRYVSSAPELIVLRWREEKAVRMFQQENIARELLIDARKSSRGTSPDSRLADSVTLRIDNGFPPSPNPAITPQLENSKPATTTYEVEELDGMLSRSESTRYIPVPPSRIITDAGNSVSPSTRYAEPLVIAPPGFRANSRFFGFDIEMARLEFKLLDDKPVDIGTRTVLLYGPPGCGKSHLARQYVWKHRNHYLNGIFWIDCKTPESLMKCYWNVALALGCLQDQSQMGPDRDFVDVVRDYLTLRDRWLMVFDGVYFETDEDLTAFLRYLPDSKGSNIIYTSTNQTLENRHRLLDPFGLKVYPLRTSQACELLYASMNINGSPSSAQVTKARQLVKHYECLPLGIHAAAYMLRARGRPLEKYVPGPPDNRLAAPFLDILAAISRNQHTEAANLLMLMCFLNHEVPIAFLHFGHNSLAMFQTEIRSLSDSSGTGKRELDNSIAVLLRNGLIERRMQTQTKASNSSAGRSSPEAIRTEQGAKKSTSPEEPFHNAPERRTPSSIDSNGRAHEEIYGEDSSPKVSQDTESAKSSSTSVGVEIIRIHTVIQNVYLENLQTISRDTYQWWLVVAVRFVIGAWNYAQQRIRKTQAAVADYREFENQVEKVWSHFPKTADKASQAVRQARHDLHSVRKVIKAEIERLTSSQSSSTGDPKGIFVSIFERSGSSSDEGPATPMSGLTRVSTWSLDPNTDVVDSPAAVQPEFVSSFVPIQAGTMWEEDVGYLSDNEKPKTRRTGSNATVTGGNYDDGAAARQTAFQSIFTIQSRNNPEGKSATAMEVSQGDVGSRRSQSDETASQQMFRPMSAGSLAEAALAAMHRPSQLQRLQSEQSAFQTGPTSTNRKPLSDISSNIPVTGNAMSKVPSNSPRLVQAVLANNAARRDLTNLPIENDIPITTTRPGRPVPIPTRSWKPSLPTLESSSMFYAYSLPSSETALPMLRDPSHESAVSNKTEPAEYTDDEDDSLQHIGEVATGSSRPSIPKLRTTSDVLAKRPPYPLLSSPETEVMPLVEQPFAVSKKTKSGLGMSGKEQSDVG